MTTDRAPINFKFLYMCFYVNKINYGDYIYIF